MGNVLTYSGITTKIKAMQSRFLKENDYRELIASETVPKAVAFLKTTAGYRELFSDFDENQLHRGEVEQQLSLSKYYDFSKLYRFANMKQRKFLDLYFIHYETIALKICIRSIFSNNPVKLNYSAFEEFFEAHSELDIVRLGNCTTLAEFHDCLKGTRYETILSRIGSLSDATLFDYEMQLDLGYFKLVWKAKDKYLDKRERLILTASLGSKMDLLNLLWISRAKEYYRMEPAGIYAMLIPIQYKIKDAQMKALVESATLADFYACIKKTYYSRFLPENAKQETKDLESLYQTAIGKIHSSGMRKNPYSIAAINAYFYFKETEIHKITTTIESIRYGLQPKDILSIVLEKE